VPIGQEHHQRIAVTMPIGFGCVDQPFNLVWRQVLAGAKVRVLWPVWNDCTIYSAWRD
jgi:hypothetical protein